MTEFSHLFGQKTRKDLADGHLWFSVINKPVHSRFTRCIMSKKQRGVFLKMIEIKRDTERDRREQERARERDIERALVTKVHKRDRVCPSFRSRVQRVSCCLSLLYLTMLTSAMWYDRIPEQGNVFTIGPFALTPEQVRPPVNNKRNDIYSSSISEKLSLTNMQKLLQLNCFI